jgi:hypothetical protein
MLAQERTRSSEQIAAMSSKLKDVQEMLFVKMREASQSNDSHVSLRAELSAMRALLEEEEKRSLALSCESILQTEHALGYQFYFKSLK